MKAIKAVYEDGRVSFSEPAPESGPVDVLVIFPEEIDDPWYGILTETTPRPTLVQWMAEVEKEIAEGKAVPLDLDQM